METEKTIGKYKIEIIQDDSPFDPRGDDNLGTMVCFHGSYSLGDKHEYRQQDYCGWNELENDIIKNEDVGVILPLYLYDHSGITMNTTGFHCPWDSGQVGFIFISKEKMRKEYSKKRISKQLKARIAGYLRNEVETYDQYLTGDCWGYVITDTEEGSQTDSCWGFFGADVCMEEAEGMLKNIIAYEEKELQE
jgi:hypothetical protein